MISLFKSSSTQSSSNWISLILLLFIKSVALEFDLTVVSKYCLSLGSALLYKFSLAAHHFHVGHLLTKKSPANINSLGVNFPSV